ncbi:hypothetical protein OSB04_012274 [Centaurea solstitialis]|uniref:GAG-pre-integrase domain-containing protein n=1 Tax=Centaurea solstitialis TaxID=347529 RepID=A0AA38WMA4_9ASTR|nr:hypothetical protein OSB04_012274 [Centaurea solstitialis]
MIEHHNTSTSKSWVFDTGCGTKQSRKLRHGELNLIMGNKHVALVDRIGNFELTFDSDLSVVLLDVCYPAEMSRLCLMVDQYFSILNVDSTSSKNGLDKTYLWHCHLGHINKNA